MIANFFDACLVELVGAKSASCTSPTLMANSTFVALSTTSKKLLCEVVRSINWLVGPNVLKNMDIMSSSDIGFLKLEVLNLYL